MITIGLTYYDNFKMFERVRDYYMDLGNPNGYEFLVVDDGSPTRPLTTDDVPDDWSLLRITEDVGWNNEGAKNLIMKEAKHEWVFLMDLDHVIFKDVYNGLFTVPQNLKYFEAPFFRRVINVESSGKVTPITDPLRQMAANTYMITKTYFWELGGYDETFQGLYGYDGSMVKKLGRVNADRLHIGLDGFTYGGGGSSWTRDEKDASKAEYHAMGKHAAGTVTERIRFPWTRLQ